MEPNKARQAARQEERDLLLMVAGAMLSNSKVVLQLVDKSLNLNDYPDGALVGLLESVHAMNRDRIWDCIRVFGVERGECSVIEAIVTKLRRNAAQRACAYAAKSLQMSSLLDPPEDWVERAERYVAGIKVRCKP